MKIEHQDFCSRQIQLAVQGSQRKHQRIQPHLPADQLGLHQVGFRPLIGYGGVKQPIF